MPKSTSVTLPVDEKTLPMATITGRTDRRTDRVRRNMQPTPREEGRIINRLLGLLASGSAATDCIRFYDLKEYDKRRNGTWKKQILYRLA